MPAANKNDKQVMDVSKPGKTAPTASAKPIILGHKPPVQDPMVTATVDPEAENPEVETVVPEAVSPASSKKVISPLSAADKEETTAETSEETKPAEDQPTPPSDDTDSVIVDAVIDQVGDKKNIDKVTEEDRKKQEHIDKLIADKKYFVPIGKYHGKSSGNVFIVTLLLFVIFMGLLVMIDAGTLDPGFTLPFSLID